MALAAGSPPRPPIPDPLAPDPLAPDPRPSRTPRTRPSGVSPGTTGLLLAWLGGAAIARLTGATAVVITLAATLVAGALAAIVGALAVRRIDVVGIELPPYSTQADPVPAAISLSGVARPVWLDVRSGGETLAGGWVYDDRFVTTVAMPRRGVVRNVHVRIRSAGMPGLVWWSKRVDVPIGEHLVAPAPAPGGGTGWRDAGRSGGEVAGRGGSSAGELDGVRPWREGDSERSVHWASTIRVGELMVHDRAHEVRQRVVVRARRGTADPDLEAGRARAAIEAALRRGAEVLAAIDDGQPVTIGDRAGAARWTALAELGTVRRPGGPKRRRQPAEPESTARSAARWWAAGSTAIALLMLTTALGYGAGFTLATVLAVAVGAAASARPLATGTPVSPIARAVVAAGALLGFVMVAAGITRLSGLLSMLRGPLPQVLLILIGLHGFECRDRRTVRVGIGIAMVVVLYAAGFRVDDALAWWLLAWAACSAVALAYLAVPTRPARSATDDGVRRRSPAVAGGVAGVVALSLGVLALVPVPAGPARLTLPTLIEDPEPIGSPGAVTGPDGEVREPGDTSIDRAPAGQAGGYNGFAESMDTSVRGALSDEVVMRVRAPAADFWRGQTFAFFDGRRWHASQEVGTRRNGPNIDTPPTLGDTADGDIVAVDEFVQTVFVEADMPNVVFAAYRPSQVILDADVWTRSDGAIRASTVFEAGDVYTVVSQRPRVDAELLRRQGRIDQRLSDLGRQVLADFLSVPPSTSAATIELATTLAAGQPSSYDVVRAYEAWMADNVLYDLDAPVPDPGEDAVDDFLFDSRLGFCEQIASAMTIMLRTQGIPARLATGYAAGRRDRLAGVYEVRASDAHAWVEVWFPETGWQPFDPTASVELSADSGVDSVGADLAAGVGRFVTDRAGLVVVAIGSLVATTALALLGIAALRRRRRGRWGVLQDRFAALAARRGSPPAETNPMRSRRWSAADDRALAAQIAVDLDRAAFDPGFVDDGDHYAAARRALGVLERSR